MKLYTELPPEPKKGELVCFDFETFGQTERKLHRPNGTFACISVNLERNPNDVYQIYDSHDLRKLYSVIRAGEWVCHNALYDLRQFLRHVNIVPRYMHDTMIAEQSMYGGLYQNFGLDDLSRRWLGKPMNKDTRVDFVTASEMTPIMKKYAADDVVATLQIAIAQKKTFDGDIGFKAYRVADEPMIFPILEMPGFRVDMDNWTKMVEEFAAKAKEIEAELEINVMSPAQVKKKAASLGIHLQDTSAVTLVEFHDRPFIQRVIEARMYRKAVSTYGMSWLEENVESDGKVYADYHITGASTTGRMSCSNPNMQNIPQRKLPQYRKQFLASDGSVIGVLDVKQQEPCILAWHSRDAKLLEAIINKEDLHLAVAREIFDNPKLTKDNKDERGVGKTINLGTSYGLTKFGLAAKLGISEEKADKFLTSYFRKFGGVFSYIQTQRQNGYRRGYVTTALGRRSYLNTYDHSWENNAINSPIQGGAADFTKVWARRAWEKCKRQGIPFTTVAYVHDETVLDIPRDVLKETRSIQNEAFQEAAELLYKGVPFEVEAEFGRSWAAKSIASEAVDIGGEDV